MKSKKLFFATLAILAFCANVTFAQAQEEKKSVKVLEISMFEVGENQNDFAGEFQHYYEKYFSSNTETFNIKGIKNPLYVNSDGVAGVIAGMGKASAAASLTSILLDPRFDFSKTIILVSGCSGMSPEKGTLGDVVIADTLVDYDLGHSWTQSDIPEGTDKTFLRSNGYDRSAYTVLNKEYVNLAYQVTKDLELTDCKEAQEYRALYNQKDQKPSVKIGTSVTSDNYWHGSGASNHADEVCSSYGENNDYLVCQMEDNAFAVVAKNFNKENQLLVIRDVVNYDQPHENQTVLESLNASSGAFSIGMTNGFIVGSTIIDNIISNWEYFNK